MKAAVVKIATAMAGAILLAGCVSIKDHRGAVIDSSLVFAIQVGTDNKDSVEKTLGRPSFEGEFTPNDWYYVSRDTKTFAFRNPRVVKERIVHISFDQAGNVAAVKTTGKELVENIHPLKAQTPTLGRKRSLFEDLFGNIGAVNGTGAGTGGQGGQGGGGGGSN